MRPVHIADVLELPVEERLELVGAIWDSLSEVPEAVELTDAQRMELDRRLEAYRLDPSEGSPWSEVKDRILKGR